jgi:hypothetical protein
MKALFCNVAVAGATIMDQYHFLYIFLYLIYESLPVVLVLLDYTYRFKRRFISVRFIKICAGSVVFL